MLTVDTSCNILSAWVYIGKRRVKGCLFLSNKNFVVEYHDFGPKISGKRQIFNISPPIFVDLSGKKFEYFI